MVVSVCICLWCANVCILGCAWSSRELVSGMCVYWQVVTVVLGWLYECVVGSRWGLLNLRQVDGTVGSVGELNLIFPPLCTANVSSADLNMTDILHYFYYSYVNMFSNVYSNRKITQLT